MLISGHIVGPNNFEMRNLKGNFSDIFFVWLRI